MRRKKREEDHENTERWLLTYSDLITLLLAFFIMMYTFSKQDAQKYQEVTSYLKTIFSGGSALAYKDGKAEGASIMPGIMNNEEIKRRIEEEVKEITTTIGLNGNISVLSDERGIVIRIMDRAFFDEGKAVLKERAIEALEKILPVLKRINNHIRIEGHTDNIPINTYEFKSNWELSVRRATEVVRYLIEKGGVPPTRVSATGYAEYRPIMPNDTPENRALNRRIEIIITKGK
ncbi:MAG: flagellar motor protein MotB [Syntrophorhabdaceae bacterium]|nr:flagellar motor protein MotB [Syntrophorhabdaceae bacterium]